MIACLDQSGVWDDELTNESEATLHSADQSENNTNVTLATAPSTPVTARVTPRAVSSAPRPQLSKSVSQPLSLVRAMQSKITSWFKTDSAPNSPTHALTRANSAVQPLTRSDTGVSAAKNSPPVAKETSPKPARQICPFYKRVPHTPIIGKGIIPPITCSLSYSGWICVSVRRAGQSDLFSVTLSRRYFLKRQ